MCNSGKEENGENTKDVLSGIQALSGCGRQAVKTIVGRPFMTVGDGLLVVCGWATGMLVVG